MSSITSLMRSGFIAPHTQPSGINKSQSIQFGWTTDILERNPSRFTLDLKPGDVFWTKDKKSPWLQGEDNLTGHWQQFIGQDPAVAKEAEKKVPHLQREKLEQVLKALVREDLEQPGFFIINGTITE